MNHTKRIEDTYTYEDPNGCKLIITYVDQVPEMISFIAGRGFTLTNDSKDMPLNILLSLFKQHIHYAQENGIQIK